MTKHLTGFLAVLLLFFVAAVPLSAAEEDAKEKAANEEKAATETEEPQACDGPEQLACGDSRDFCKKQAGFCEDLSTEGVCMRPTEECTDEYEPVCGCDGVNYRNECWAHAEGMNVAFYDECEDGD